MATDDNGDEYRITPLKNNEYVIDMNEYTHIIQNSCHEKADTSDTHITTILNIMNDLYCLDE